MKNNQAKPVVKKTRQNIILKLMKSALTMVIWPLHGKRTIQLWIDFDKRDRLKAITLTQKLYGLDVPTIVMLLDLLLDIPVNIRPDIKIRFSYCLTHPGPTKHISQHSNTHFTIKGRALWSDHSISIFILWSDQGVWDSWSGEQDVFLDGLPDMLRMQQYAKIMKLLTDAHAAGNSRSP